MKKQNTPAKKELRSMLFSVTPLSKFMALSLFITLPFLAFYVGYNIAMSAVLVACINQ